MLIIHFVGLTMGLGTSIAHAFLGIATAKMSEEEAVKFRLHTLALSRMGYLGLALLILSGIYLMTPFWDMLSSSPLLMIKLGLVLLLVVLISLLSKYGKRTKSVDAETLLKKTESIGKLTLLIGVSIVILAVYIFH